MGAAGRLHPLYRGVYAYGHALCRRRASGWRRSSPRARAPRWPGCARRVLLGSRSRRAAGDRRASSRSRARHSGFRRRTCRNLDPRDIIVVDGIPVTTRRADARRPDRRRGRRRPRVPDPRGRVPRQVQPRPRRVAAMGRANGRRDLTVLEEALRLHLSGSAGSRSRLEKRFRRLVLGAGFPAPRINVIVNGYEVDAYWPGLCVEIDGAGTAGAHAGRGPDQRRGAARRRATSSCASARTTSTCAPARVLAQLAAQQLPRRVAGE